MTGPTASQLAQRAQEARAATDDLAPAPPAPDAVARPVGGEVRIVNETTGAEKGQKPQAFDLVPWLAVMKVSEVYRFGQGKYAAHNWRRGYAWSLSYAAAIRHLAAWWEGEDEDEESDLPHLAHATFHLFSLLTFMVEHPELDDRPQTVLAADTSRGT